MYSLYKKNLTKSLKIIFCETKLSGNVTSVLMDPT